MYYNYNNQWDYIYILISLPHETVQLYSYNMVHSWNTSLEYNI